MILIRCWVRRNICVVILDLFRQLKHFKFIPGDSCALWSWYFWLNKLWKSLDRLLIVDKWLRYYKAALPSHALTDNISTSLSLWRFVTGDLSLHLSHWFCQLNVVHFTTADMKMFPSDKEIAPFISSELLDYGRSVLQVECGLEERLYHPIISFETCPLAATTLPFPTYGIFCQDPVSVHSLI